MKQNNLLLLALKQILSCQLFLAMLTGLFLQSWDWYVL